MSDTTQFGHGSSEKPESAPSRFYGREAVYKRKNSVVLVMVDDDEDDCILVEAALKEACFNCTFRCVQNGLEMMEYLKRSGRYSDPESAPVPDLILLDLNMPKMNGRQVLERLKNDPAFRAIPIIVLTTSSDVEDIRICYDLGANSYVVKQATFDGILFAIKAVKEYWLEVASLPPKTYP